MKCSVEKVSGWVFFGWRYFDLRKMLDEFVNGNNLPYFVFSKNYDKYFFFDNVLFSDLDVLRGIVGLAKAAGDIFVRYFRFDDFGGEKLVLVDDLIDFVSSDEKRRVDDFIFSGGWIFSGSGAWGAFQRVPVGLGVVGVAPGIGLDESVFDKDVFFRIDDWSKESLDNLVANYGEDYVAILLGSYVA